MLYKCRNCGGELAFDPSTGKLKCKFCDAVYDLSEYDEHAGADHPGHDHEHGHEQEPQIPSWDSSAEENQPEDSAAAQGFVKSTDGSTDIPQDLAVYACPHCGAEVVTDKNTVATHCIFCDTPLILQEQMTGSFAPEYVIPFAVDKKQIEQIYENYIRTKPFYPPEYSTSNVIDHIKSVYLPFWMYDFVTSGELTGTGEKTWTRTTRDWIITEHDVFQIYRAGSMEFSKIPVIASSKTPRNAMDSIEPYDYSRMVPFNNGYLPGFLAERYDINQTECAVPAKTRATNTFDASMTSTVQGYTAVNMGSGSIQHDTLKNAFVLLPAYILFMDFTGGKEDKLIAINGQTGKIVGNVPVDKHKRNRFALIVFLAVFIPLLLIFWFGVIG